jgi:hypothetical protein
VSNKKWSAVLFLASVIFVLGSTYIPDAFFKLLSLFDYHYTEIRMLQLIKSFQLCGVLLTCWGIALLLKKEEPK